MPTIVKNFHSAVSSVPQLSGSPGALIGVLDACLVTGFGQKTVDSLVVSGGVATMTISSGHSFEKDAVLLVAGVTPTALNGEKTCTNTTTTTVVFPAPGVADQTATGTITVKWAPAGWEKTYSGTYLAVYRSLDVTSTRMYLRVDDTGTTSARWVGYESMTDVNTGTGPFPTNTQVSGGLYQPKSANADTTSRAWTLFADNKTFYLHVHTSSASQGVAGGISGFGDFESFKIGDPYAAFISSTDQATAATTNTTNLRGLEYAVVNTSSAMYMPRSYTALGGAQQAYHATLMTYGAYVIGAADSAAVGGYPNRPNNGLFIDRKWVYEPNGVGARGRLRGLKCPMQSLHAAFNWRDKIAGQNELLGRTLLAVKCGNYVNTTSVGAVFFDITGPWE